MVSGRAFHACAVLLITVTSLTACSTFPALQVWQSEPGVTGGSLTIELGSTEPGTESVRIHGGPIEGATFTGNARLTADGRLFSLTEMHSFSNWANGWTEARFTVTGELLLSPNGRGWSISVVQQPQLGAPVAASMRYFDDYLAGERALEEFTHRWDRVQAVVDVLRQKLQERWFDYTVAPWQPGRRSEAMSFEEATRQFLFPEVYGYPEPPRRDSQSVRAEAINWNVDYTAANFPENLRAIRNSGTMLRDFEECLGLWRLAYCLDELWSHRIGGITFRLVMQNPSKPALDPHGRPN
jgi:hypothetical protein